MTTTLEEVIRQVEHLELAQQQALAVQFQQVLDAFLQEEAAHKVFTDEIAWMKRLGMSDKSIARVMAEPLEPGPGEAYLDADA